MLRPILRDSCSPNLFRSSSTFLFTPNSKMCAHGGPRGAIWHPVFGRVVNLEPPQADIRLLCGIFMAGTGHVICGNQHTQIMPNIKKRQNGRCDGDEVDRPSLYIASDVSMSSCVLHQWAGRASHLFCVACRR